MNKKIVLAVISMALLMMLSAVPVMAKPKESSPAWHTYSATDSYYEVTYGQLTDMCLASGLSENLYPVPTTPNTIYDPQTFVLYIYGDSEYYVFTITIGDEVYQGIACNTYDMSVNLFTGNGHIDYQTTHYFGDLGKMNHGFAGVATVDFYNYGTDDYYFTCIWMKQGFDRFTGQTLMLWQDSRTSAIGTGDCIMLGNKWY